jgi:hypothetical protein
MKPLCTIKIVLIKNSYFSLVKFLPRHPSLPKVKQNKTKQKPREKNLEAVQFLTLMTS